MSSVNVSIFSRSYNVACKPGEEDKLHDAAEMFNDELMRLKQSVSGEVEYEKLVVIAGINMCARHRKVLQTYTADMKTVMDNNIELANLLADLPTPEPSSPSVSESAHNGSDEANGSVKLDEADSTEAVSEPRSSAEGLHQEADQIVIEDTSDNQEGLDFFDDEDDDTAV